MCVCIREGLMLKLKLQYFGHLMQRTHSLEKTLMPGKIEGRRRRGQQRMRWLDGITESMDMLLGRTERAARAAELQLCAQARERRAPAERWSGRSPGGGHRYQYSRLGFPWTEEPGGLQSMGSQKSQDEGDTEVPGTASSEPLLPS